MFNRPHASVVMAAFCHPRPTGARFTDRSAAPGIAVALRRLLWQNPPTTERTNCARSDTSTRGCRCASTTRTFRNHFMTSAQRTGRSQLLPARRLLSVPGFDGALRCRLERHVYRSVRHERGECLACFRPRLGANAEWRLTMNFVGKADQTRGRFAYTDRARTKNAHFNLVRSNCAATARRIAAFQALFQGPELAAGLTSRRRWIPARTIPPNRPPKRSTSD